MTNKSKSSYPKNNKPKHIRLFKNPLLEKLSVVSPRMFSMIWATVLALAVFASWKIANLSTSAAFLGLGGLFWTLTEYATHRFLFHLQIPSKRWQRLMFLAHGNHHVDPSDPMRAMMPPVVSLTVCGAFWCLFLKIFGSVGTLVFLGFAIGYVVYDALHYAFHQHRLSNNRLRKMKRHHLYHHSGRKHGNYAVTGLFWDSLFGTRIDLASHKSEGPGRVHDAGTSRD